MYRCVNPQICGVNSHRSMRNCTAAKQATTTRYDQGIQSVSSIPASATTRSIQDNPPSIEVHHSVPRGTVPVVMLQEWRNEDGWLHREDGPAQINYDRDGRVTREEWRVDGEFQKLCLHEYKLNGDVNEIWLNIDVPSFNYWSCRSHMHREDGPADITTDKEGRIKKQDWFLDGKRHRDDGPSSQLMYSGTHQIKALYWHQHGVAHREDGPAYQYWTINGELVSEEYHIDGTEMNSDEFERYIESRRAGLTDEMSRAWAGLE